MNDLRVFRGVNYFLAGLLVWAILLLFLHGLCFRLTSLEESHAKISTTDYIGSRNSLSREKVHKRNAYFFHPMPLIIRGRDLEHNPKAVKLSIQVPISYPNTENFNLNPET